MNQVITISREFGSGGRELGFRLAEKLGIPFYDKELISMAAENSDMAESAFLEHDEIIAEQTPYVSYMPFSPIYQIPMSDQIFVEQSKVIRMLGEKGPCVIVGRCADMILADSINLFICAKLKKRVERLMGLETGVEPEKLEERIREVDRKRKDYYQYFTGNTWGKAQNYHLCLDSGRVGIEGCLNAIAAYLEAAH